MSPYKLKIEYYRAGALVAVDDTNLRLASIQKLALEGMTRHGADQAKVLDTSEGSKVVTVFAGPR